MTTELQLNPLQTRKLPHTADYRDLRSKFTSNRNSLFLWQLSSTEWGKKAETSLANTDHYTKVIFQTWNIFLSYCPPISTGRIAGWKTWKHHCSKNPTWQYPFLNMPSAKRKNKTVFKPLSSQRRTGKEPDVIKNIFTQLLSHPWQAVAFLFSSNS